MIRTLLTTSAVALVLGTAAIAQTPAPTNEVAPANEMAPANETAPANEMAPANETAPADATTPAPAADGAAPAVDAPAADTTLEADEPWDMSAGYIAGEGDALVSELMGAPVFSTMGEDAEQIGTVNDLVISVDGEIHAVVIGVGGFLGIGEKNVAVDFQELEYGIAFDNTERWVLPTTAEALTAAPDFIWEDDLGTDPAMAPADPAMDPAAPADPAVAPADPAMAPADPAMDADQTSVNTLPREGYAPVEVEALTAENLTGAIVVGPEGEDIAAVGDILLTADGQVDAMLIDFGGFLGIGEKRVAVGLDNLEFAANENGDLVIYSDFTREQLEAQPEYDEATYAEDPAQRATDM